MKAILKFVTGTYFLSFILTLISALILFIFKFNHLQIYIFSAITLVVSELISFISMRRNKTVENAINFAAQRIKHKDFGNIQNNKNSDVFSRAYNSLFEDLKAIILSLKDISDKLSNLSGQLVSDSNNIKLSVNQIASTVGQISKGAAEQAADAENGVSLINGLSDQIKIVYDNSLKLANQSKSVMNLNKDGIEAVNMLKERTQKSSETSDDMLELINSFNNKAKDISKFVESISSIAEQTNLLALNAAIEASHAGESGKGFGVVAEEIRVLADDSKKTAVEIQKIVKNIEKESVKVDEITRNQKEVSNSQNEAVNKTINIYNSITGLIEKTYAMLGDVNAAIDNMETSKESVINAIQNISAVSQQTAAASEEVASGADEQLKLITGFANSSKSLNDLIMELNANINKYKLQ